MKGRAMRQFLACLVLCAPLLVGCGAAAPSGPSPVAETPPAAPAGTPPAAGDSVAVPPNAPGAASSRSTVSPLPSRPPLFRMPAPSVSEGPIGAVPNPGPVTGYGPGGIAHSPGTPPNPPYR
jgi:hypothetical protein